MDIINFFDNPIVQLSILFFTYYQFYQLGRKSVMKDLVRYVNQETENLQEEELDDMYIEKMHGQFYLYMQDDSFVAQGTTIADLVARSIDVLGIGQYKIATNNLTEDERQELINSLKNSLGDTNEK
jgi:hypothetical protein